MSKCLMCNQSIVVWWWHQNRRHSLGNVYTASFHGNLSKYWSKEEIIVSWKEMKGQGVTNIIRNHQKIITIWPLFFLICYLGPKCSIQKIGLKKCFFFHLGRMNMLSKFSGNQLVRLWYLFFKFTFWPGGGTIEKNSRILKVEMVYPLWILE